MSYNKFLNKVQYNSPNSENGLLNLNSNNQILLGNNNFKIFEKVKENIKVNVNEKKEITFLNISGSYLNKSGSVSTYENVISNNLIIDSLYFLNNNDDLILSSSKNIQISSGNIDINSKFQSKNIYGNLQYVKSSSISSENIAWIQPTQSNNIKVELDNLNGGFKFTKKNIHLEYATYVTCDPDSQYSSYSKSDIISNSNISGSYNFINDIGTYTNCLYFRPGMTDETTRKYLSGGEHTFVFDFQRDLLPGWGFESNHPLNNISNYVDNNLKDEILNDVDAKKKSQSIIFDLSKLIDSGKVSPGYKINLVFKDPSLDYPEAVPAIIHNSNNITINDVNDNWVNYTFDSMCAQFSKSDLDSNLTVKNKLNISIGTNIINLSPYYNSNSTPTIPLPSPSCQRFSGCTFTNPGNSNINNLYYRQFGQYYNNKFLLYYYKPLFFVNLGRNNEIKNNTQTVLKKIENNNLNKQNPYFINLSFKNKLSSIFAKNIPIDINYFISNNTNEVFSHLSLIDENNSVNQLLGNTTNPPLGSYNKLETNTSNLYKNFTFKLNINNENLIFSKNILLNFYRIYVDPTINKKSCNNTTTCGSGGIVSTETFNYFFNFIKSKCINLIPFTYITSNDLIDVNNTDFYYFNSFKINNNNIKYNSQNADLSINSLQLENSNSLTFKSDNIISNPYSMDLSKSEFILKYPNSISLIYLGHNVLTQKNEWIYA